VDSKDQNHRYRNEIYGGHTYHAKAHELLNHCLHSTKNTVFYWKGWCDRAYFICSIFK